MRTSRTTVLGVVALVVVSTAIACSTNPATGHSQLNLYSVDQEIALGRQYDQQVQQEIGVYNDPDLQRYVDGLGRQLAAHSERPNLPWHFAVVDDSAVNAFALPGGFVYVTRGLIDHMGSEAELAAVMGHEIGHVTARHSVNQLSKQQLTQIGLAVGMILSPTVAQYGDLANLAGGLLFLKFSRDDETQADDLGLRYISNTGYPPDAMERVFTLLSRVSQTEQGGRLPSWLSTHPDPQQRLQRTEARLARLPPGQGSTGYRRDALLQEVEGVIYGPDPRQGFFRRGVFYQPELGIAVEGPPGWKATNQRDAVVWQPRNGDAVFALTLSNAPSSRAAAEQFFSQQGIQQVGGWPGTAEGGLGGQFVVQTQQGPLAGGVTFVEDGNRVYRLIGYAQQGRFNSYANEIVRSVQSFRRVGSREVGRVEPWRVHVVSVGAPTSLDEIARRSSSTVPLQKIALLNNVEPNTTFASGEKVKLVVGGVEGATVD